MCLVRCRKRRHIGPNHRVRDRTSGTIGRPRGDPRRASGGPPPRAPRPAPPPPHGRRSLGQPRVGSDPSDDKAKKLARGGGPWAPVGPKVWSKEIPSRQNTLTFVQILGNWCPGFRHRHWARSGLRLPVPVTSDCGSDTDGEGTGGRGPRGGRAPAAGTAPGSRAYNCRTRGVTP